MSFSELGLGQKTLKGIKSVGYETPTPIQAQIIPHVLKGCDVFGCAQTGTGKTASYTLPMLDLLEKGRKRARMPRALVLAPTRELALQVKESVEAYGEAHSVKLALVIGGTSMAQQEKALDQGVDILVATPGRLLDIFERGKILLTAVEVLVIDEADRMLDMGFIPEVEKIVSFIPRAHQTLFFSATVPDQIRKLSKKFLKNPVEVSVSPTQRTAETVEQFKLKVPPRDKRKILRALLKNENADKAIIFCNRKKDVSALASSLNRYGFKAGQLHGDLAQATRSETLTAFKEEGVSILVASDVAARGLDVDQLPLVFNFDVPFNAEEYVHRVGRTGRAGQKGKAFTLVTDEDKKFLDAIEKLIKHPIPEFKLDSLKGDGKSEKKSSASPRALDGSRKGDGASKKSTGESQKTSSPSVKTIKESSGPVQGFGDQPLPAFFNLEWKPLKSGKPKKEEKIEE